MAMKGNRLRLGAVGCGRVFARYHLPALRKSPDWTLVSVCDVSTERLEYIHRSFAEPKCFRSFSDLLRSTALDAVLITTPPPTHCYLTLEALEAGHHVLVEKPMASDGADAEVMLRASLRAERQLWVGFNRRFRRSYLKLRERLVSLPREAIRSIHYELIVDAQRWQSLSTIREEEGSGGGVLDDVASHQLDLLPWLTSRNLREICASQRREESNGACLIEYDVRLDDGLVVHCLAGRSGYYSEHLEVELPNRSLIVGPGGLHERRWMPAGWTRLFGRANSLTHLVSQRLAGRPNMTAASFECQLASFAGAIRGDKVSYKGADAASGLRSVLAVRACRESLECGGTWQFVSSEHSVENQR